MEQYYPTLTQCPLFAQVAPAELPELLRCLQARVTAYGKNQTVLQEGDPARYVGIVLEGQVQVVRDDFYGNRRIVATIQPPELFAEAFACAGEQSMPVSVVTAAPAKILLLDCQKIRTPCANACRFHQRLIQNLLQVLAQKNLLLHQKLELTGRRTTREKLLAYLLQEAKQAGSSTFTIPYDRQQLADYLGVERSAMSAELGKLRRDGMLDFHRSRFTLHAMEKNLLEDRLF